MPYMPARIITVRLISASSNAGGTPHGSFDSTKMNMPSVRFGNAVREAQELVFISKEHDKTSCGHDSPGTR